MDTIGLICLRNVESLLLSTIQLRHRLREECFEASVVQPQQRLVSLLVVIPPAMCFEAPTAPAADDRRSMEDNLDGGDSRVGSRLVLSV